MFTMILEVDATETLTRIFRFLFRDIYYFRYPNYVCISGSRITFSEEGGLKGVMKWLHREASVYYPNLPL